MQQHRGQLMEEDLSSTKERLARTEGERDGLRNELKQMKKEADDANARLSQSMSKGKVADVFSELNSVVESLSKSNEELAIKELAIKSLKDELIKARDIEAQFAEKDADLHRLEAELAKSRERIRQLETETEKTKNSEPEVLPESPLKEIEMLKSELKRAIEAEENNKKAMDDLALALKEVATEASQAKEKLAAAQDEVQLYKNESEELKEALKTLDEKHKSLLEEAKKEADLQRNIADRLRLEAEETLEAWNGKETGLVDCIKRAEDEKIAAVEENTKLLEALTVAENMNKTAKQENQKLRDILKQALNEANVAKEAAGIARSENSQLKDLLAEKDDALIFITRENENLRINEVATMEQIKELKRLLSESPGYRAEDEEHEKHSKTQSSTDNKEPRQRKLSNAFSLNLKDLITYPKHKDTHDQDHKIHEKLNESEEEEDEENANLFKGSIFDVTTDSPLAAAAAEKNQHHHHHHSRKHSFADEGETGLNPDELEHIDGAHIDEAEIERNSKKKRALLRRFGDIIIRRKGGMHRRELSNGGEIQKKETSAAAGESHRKEPTSAPAASSEAYSKKEAFAEPAA